MRLSKDHKAAEEASDGAEASLFSMPPFGADQLWRERHLGAIVAALSDHHYRNCAPYRNILEALDIGLRSDADLADQPYLPIGLFKRLTLRSVPASEVLRTLTSSGTSQSARSQIFVDRKTSLLQMRALSRILTSLIGHKRLPLLIIDMPHGAADPAGYAARMVAIQGFSLFANGSPTFALNQDMQPDFGNILGFLQRTQGRRFLVFGFTYVIWKYFLECLSKIDVDLDFSNGVLIHGGGWKRLAGENVNDDVFKSVAKRWINLGQVHNYYGMVEQPGSIYLQCERGLFHCSNFSEIIIRRPDLTVAEVGEPGVIQTISVLPKSYPGHNLLTDDLGVLRGQDDCPCGRQGRYFDVLGRLPAAEPKGCGDVPRTAHDATGPERTGVGLFNATGNLKAMGEIVPESLRQDGNAAADPPGPTALRSPLRSPLSDGVEFLVGQASDWDPVQNVRVRETFDREAIGFLDTLSRRLMSDPAARQFPDVVAFAFWCRGSALRVLRSVFEDGRVSLGRGLGFHVAPANVPIMAAYNLAIGLLAGNSTIVRLPSRGIPQTEYLCRQIVTLLDCDAHAALRCSMACIKYDRERTDVTRYLSARCDARVIWGGDATVNEIRRTPLQPHASELTFPDRFSIAVIDSEAWLRAGDKDRLVHGFYNDTYLNDQASCSAPRLVLWLGSRMADARADFWGRVEALVADRHRPVPAQTLRKLEFAYCLLARDRGCRLDSRYPHVMRVWSETLRPDLLDLHPDGGVFVECQGQGIDVLRPILARRCQTVSYLGVPADDIVTLIRNAGTQGGDRVVPMGQTLDFSLTWDGHDILRALSRTLSVVAIPSNRGNA